VSRDQVIVGAMIALAFPLLVLERRFAALHPAAGGRPSPHLSTAAADLHLMGLVWPMPALVRAAFTRVAERAVLVSSPVALELLLRGVSYIFFAAFHLWANGAMAAADRQPAAAAESPA